LTRNALAYSPNGEGRPLSDTAASAPKSAIATAKKAGGFVWIGLEDPDEKEMADGAKRVCNATVAVAVTGVAGSQRDGAGPPSAPTAAGDKPVGTVCFALAGPKSTKTSSKFFTGGRDRIRRAAAYYALDLARRLYS